MRLTNAKHNTEYKIKAIQTEDEELISFLFTLGCYSGEKIKIVTCLKDSFVILIKGSRYNVDKHLANVICI